MAPRRIRFRRKRAKKGYGIDGKVAAESGEGGAECLCEWLMDRWATSFRFFVDLKNLKQPHTQKFEDKQKFSI